jgi:hypothetical protein
MKSPQTDTLSNLVQAAQLATPSRDTLDPQHDAANPLLLAGLSGFVSVSRTPYLVCLETGVLRISEGTGDSSGAREGHE